MSSAVRVPIDSTLGRNGEAPAIEFAQLMARLGNIENALNQLLRRNTMKEYYTTAEVAELLDKAEFTVREWCRLNRVYAEKRQTGRGRDKEWIISHQELTRIRNEGLLPLD